VAASIRKLAPYILVVLAAAVAYHFNIVFAGEVYSPSGDITYQNYPWRDFYGSELRDGRLALWHPYQACGFPLFAEGQTGMLYPPNFILHRFFPTWTALMLGSILHTILAGLGAFALFLRLGIRERSATLGALVFMLCGPMSAHLGHFNLVAVAAWIPWLVFAGLNPAIASRSRHARSNPRSVLSRARLSVFLAISFVILMMWLAGHPQMAMIGIITLAVFLVAVFFTSPRGSRPHPGWLFIIPAAGIFTGTALALPQLVPTLELLALSNRAGFTMADFLSYSLPPHMLITAVNAFAFGPANAWNSPGYFGPSGFVERVCLIGALPLLIATLVYIVLATDVVRKIRRKLTSAKPGIREPESEESNTGDDAEPLEKPNSKAAPFGELNRTVKVLAIVGIISVILAFGKWGGLYYLLKLIPGYGATRIPARFLFPAILAIAGLFAAGFEFLVLKRFENDPFRRVGLYILILAFLITMWPLLSFHRAFNITSSEKAATPVPQRFVMAKEEGTCSRVFRVITPESGTEKTGEIHELDFNIPCYPSVAGIGNVGWAGELVIADYMRFFETALSSNGSMIQDQRRSDVISWLNALPTELMPFAQSASKGIYLCGSVKKFESDDAIFSYIESNYPLYLDKIALVTEDTGFAPSMKGSFDVSLVLDENSRQVYKIEADENKIFVRTTAFHPGWRAWLDGVDAQIIKVDGAFQGVAIPAGEHELVMEFMPGFQGMIVIWAYSVIALFAVFIAFLFLLRRSDARSKHPGESVE